MIIGILRKMLLPVVLYANFVICSFTSVNAQRNIDVLHYKYNIELNDNSDTIHGLAEIKVKFLAPSDELKLDLMSPAQTGKGMRLGKILGPNVKRTLGVYTFFTIQFSNTFLPGDTATFVIPYSGIPEDGLIISRNKFGRRTFFSDNWPDRAHYWIPCNDDPSDKASVEFLVTAPDHYKVVSNGILQEEKELPGNKKLSYWKEDIPLPTKIMVIGAADFAIDSVDTVDNVPVSSWVFAQNKMDGFKDYSIAPGILSFFIDYIGPFPYKKLANVQSKTIFGGMENAGAIFYSENSVDGKQDHESLIAHEIVHQWFGDMATEKNFAHLWLSEGFATYLAHIYIESKYGTDSLNTEMKNDRDEVIAFGKDDNHPVVDSVSPYMSLLNANSYQKGSWVLHMLRRQLGDSIFHQAIREYYAAYAGKNADTHDLQQVFEKVSGRDLSVFFKQWLYTAGNPSLDIKWKYSAPDKKMSVTVTQLQESLFQFPLEIGLKSASGKTKTETLFISNKTETFSLSVSDAIVQVVPDPATSLLFEVSLEKIK